MKVAMYYSREDIRIENIDTPEIGGDEALVQMKACGICGSDLMDWYLRSRAPLVLGHEPTGIITRKGNRVKNVDVGDRVFVHHHVACLKCHYCQRGDYTSCKEFHETNIKPGGFTEYFKVPAPNLLIDTLKIPDTMSFEEGTLIEPVGCCIRAIERCRIATGDTVAIIGAGPTGLIHTSVAKIYGAAKTIVSDLFEYRLDIAKEFGADVTVDPKKEDFVEVAKAETDGRGVDLVIVTAPSLAAYKAGLSICRKGGKLCAFAPTSPEEYLQVSPKDLFLSEIQILPSYSTSHLETRSALALMTTGRLDVRKLITHRFRLDEVATAFKTALEGRESLKIVLVN